MAGSDVLAALADFPRDGTIVIERHRGLAETLYARGYHVVLVGQPSERLPWVATGQALNDSWSRLSCRSPHAACFGTPELCDLTRAMSERSSVNGNTSAFRSRGWVRNLIRNLPALLGPTAMQARPSERVPAFIVGAGTSLDLNHELLAEASSRGIVIAVNGACRLPGVDVALTVESNDIRHKLGPLDHVQLRAFGMVSDPAVMGHGRGTSVPVYVGELSSLLEPLVGEPRLACSAHGGTAALSLAERWGCDPIVLVGHDFACTDRVYPKCLELGDTRVTRDGNVFRFDWDPVLAAQPRANPLHAEETAVEVPGLEGRKIWTTQALNGTAKWFESAARAIGGGARLWNASEMGAQVAGWTSRRLRDVLGELPTVGYEIRAGNGVPPAVLTEWIRDNIDGAAMVVDACERVAADPDAGLATLLRALRTAPLVEPWCLPQAAEVMGARRSEPMARNPRAEWQRARDDSDRLASAIRAALPELVSELEEACSSITRCRPEQ